jgi:hypothetical protein
LGVSFIHKRRKGVAVQKISNWKAYPEVHPAFILGEEAFYSLLGKERSHSFGKLSKGKDPSCPSVSVLAVATRMNSGTLIAWKSHHATRLFS